ncbi:ABC transporter permease, partial [Nocardioides hankookensis]
MSTMTYAVQDSATLFRRNLKHLLRYPSLTITIIAMPVVFLLLFTYVFGGTLGAGLPGGAASADPRADYLHYLTPAILVMTVVAVAQSTAILVAKDATEGIIDRFKTLPIARSAPLNGHVLAAMAQTVFALVVVLAVALGLGYRSDTSVVGWA